MNKEHEHQVICGEVCGVGSSRTAHYGRGIPMKFVRRDRVGKVACDILPFQGEGARGITDPLRKMREVMPCDEHDKVADAHQELHVVIAHRLPNDPIAGTVRRMSRSELGAVLA